MNNKKILILIICSAQLAGIVTEQKTTIRKKPSIDNFFGTPCTFPDAILENIGKKIVPSILGKKEWWYLENIIPHEILIYDIGHNATGTTIVTKSDRLRIFNATTLEQNASFPLNHRTDFTTYTSTENIQISAQRNTIQILDKNTQEEIASFPHEDNTYFASYSPKKNQLITASFDKRLRIFNRHERPTLDQVVLKKLMSTWLTLQKPEKSITTIEILFTNISSLLKLDYTELMMVWSSFSENMQIAIFETMRHKIQTYGKTTAPSKKKRHCSFKFLIPQTIQNLFALR